MKAITVQPGRPASVDLEDRPEPPDDPRTLLVQALALGVCGTDREIISGAYGWAPPEAERLILGHESLGRVMKAPANSGFVEGDLVVGIVRRRDPVPCPACAAGEWDMCLNGRYTERGIKSIDGYGAERWRLEPDYAIKVDPSLGLLGVLLEPASILAKAWDHIDRIGHRTASWQPKSVLVTGAGPVGLLAALMASQRGLDLHVVNRSDSGPKRGLVRDLGGHFHTHLDDNFRADIIVECSGALPVVADVVKRITADGVICLTGVTSPGRSLPFDFGSFNRDTVLHNSVTFGTVNANRDHYIAAAAALAKADRQWLSRLITRRVPLTEWRDAFTSRPDDIKVVLQFAEAP